MAAKQTGWVGMLIVLGAVSAFAQVVHVETSFSGNTTCGHNTNGTFSAIIDEKPYVEAEYALGEPEYAWSGDDLLGPTDKETVKVAFGADRTGSVSASVTVTWPVYYEEELCEYREASADCSVKIKSGVAVSFSPGMLGLDRTDAGATNKPGGAAAKLACGHTDSFFTWARNTGACEIPKELPCEGQGLASVTYQTISKESCSRVLADQKVEVTASPGGNATTNFTVVKVDVTIDGVGEDKEETEGAFIAYAEDNVEDNEDGTWTEQVFNALVGVTIQCFPDNLPDDETVLVSFPVGCLYEGVDDYYVAAQPSYKANEINNKQFVLRGNKVSDRVKDQTIQVTHGGSGATDVAMFTVAHFDVKKIEFISDHGCLIDVADNYANANGNVFSPRGWVRDGENNPISHSKGKNMKIEATVIIQPSGLRYDLEGKGESKSLSFQANNLISTGNDQVLELTSSVQLPAKIDMLLSEIEWNISTDYFGYNCAPSGPHEIYVTWGEPVASSEVTHKRMWWACTLGSKAMSCTEAAEKVGRAISNDPGYQSPRTYNVDAWQFLDSGKSGDCITLAELSRVSLGILGIPASAHRSFPTADGTSGFPPVSGQSCQTPAIKSFRNINEMFVARLIYPQNNFEAFFKIEDSGIKAYTVYPYDGPFVNQQYYFLEVLRSVAKTQYWVWNKNQTRNNERVEKEVRVPEAAAIPVPNIP